MTEQINDTAASIEITRIATHDDLEHALAIRKKVFVEEQGAPADLESEGDEQAVHFIARYGSVPAAAARYRVTANGYKLERFAVLKEYRGKKIGEAMVKTIVGQLPRDGREVYLNSQTTAIDFYKKLGFTTQGEEFEEAGIKHFRMIKSS